VTRDQNMLWLLISIGVLAVMAIFWLRQVLKRRRARTWPTGQGRVDSTAVGLVGSGTQQSKFVAEVRYSYTVEGRNYSGVLRRSFMRKGSADKWIGDYPNGRTLIVRYNSNKARDSVLFEREQAGTGT
jgi:hypothetical protein